MSAGGSVGSRVSSRLDTTSTRGPCFSRTIEPRRWDLLSELMGMARGKLGHALEYTSRSPAATAAPAFLPLATVHGDDDSPKTALDRGPGADPAKVKISRSSVLLVVCVTKLIFWSNGLLRLWFRWLSRGLPEVPVGVEAESVPIRS
jgi:hypothetical protein